MKRLDGSCLALAAILVLFSQIVMAAPTFQAYISGGAAETRGLDEDTWFTSDSTFDLIVVGAYNLGGSKETINLTQTTLVLSVPQREKGTVSITGADGAALLFYRAAVSGTSFYNPNADADVDLLTDIAGTIAGYDGYSTKSFLPEKDNGHAAVDNNHYPFQNSVSDFLLFAIGDFDNVGAVHNYNADDGGSITDNDGFGEEKTFCVSITGFSTVHFDVYGYVVNSGGGNWAIAPGSHDSTYCYIPAPGAILLGTIGVSIIGWLRRRRTI